LRFWGSLQDPYMSIEEIDAAFIKIAGGEKHPSGMPVCSHGTNAIAFNDMTQKSRLTAYVNPNNNRIIKIEIALNNIGPPENFSYAQCFKNAQKVGGVKTAKIEYGNLLAKVLDDAINDFTNVQGKLEHDLENRKFYGLKFEVPQHPIILLGIFPKDKVGKYNSPRKQIRSLLQSEINRLGAEVKAEILEKQIKAIYPDRTFERTEDKLEGDGRRVELIMPYVYNGKDAEVKYYGAYLKIVIKFYLSPGHSDKYEVTIYAENLKR
jgi:hypothetical protein